MHWTSAFFALLVSICIVHVLTFQLDPKRFEHGQDDQGGVANTIPSSPNSAYNAFRFLDRWTRAAGKDEAEGQTLKPKMQTFSTRIPGLIAFDLSSDQSNGMNE